MSMQSNATFCASYDINNSLKTLDRQVDVYSTGLYVIKTTLPSFSIFN